jgi:hypothetical protein
LRLFDKLPMPALPKQLKAVVNEVRLALTHAAASALTHSIIPPLGTEDKWFAPARLSVLCGRGRPHRFERHAQAVVR